MSGHRFLVYGTSAVVLLLTCAGFIGYEVIPVDQLDLMSPTLKRDRRNGR